VVIGRGWSRDYTWVILIGLQMCVGMFHMGCQFKIPRNNPGDSAAWGVTIALLTVCGGDDERT